MSNGRWLWVWVAIVGCGSASPEPAAPDEAPPVEAAAPESDTDIGEEADDEEASPPLATAETDTAEMDSGPLSNEDLSKVMQAVLDDPMLEGYLKTDRPGRAPVKLSGDDLAEELDVMKGGYPVKVVEAPKSDKDPVLVITRIDHEGSIVTVKYRHAVEGIKGTSRVKREGSGWQLMSSRIMQ